MEFRLTSDEVWRQLGRASFAIVSYVTPAGEPRSSGVVYCVADRRLYAVTAPESWKARHLGAGGKVAVTVPVRRGGIMSLLVPIPPATITFHGTATLYPPGSVAEHPQVKALASLLPAERRGTGRVVEIVPEGRFLTYGVGIPLAQMRSPTRALARVPVA